MKLYQKIVERNDNELEAQFDPEMMTQVKQDIELLEMTRNTIGQFEAGNLDSNWVKFTDSPDLKLYFREEEGEASLYTVYGERIINAKMFDVMAIVAEV